MSNEEEKNVLDHNYDGIQELDNPLPTWWLTTFYITIFFAFIYYIHYEFAAGPSLDAELKAAMTKIEKLQAEHGGGDLSEADLLAFTEGDGALENGKVIYDGKCAVCHGNELQGLIGPNLTDNYWIHGKGDLQGVFDVVLKGAIDKGMPPWDGLLTREEIAQVSGYILSKVGSNPAQAKAPEGVEIAN